MVLSLYTLHAPRRNLDYSLMKLSNDMKDDKFNYLDIDKKKHLIFNNYKTNGKYNSVIEDELMKVILLYLSNQPEKSILKKKNYDVHF
jgi:hypothetical protein